MSANILKALLYLLQHNKTNQISCLPSPVFEKGWDILKGQSPDFTHQIKCTCRVEYYSAFENNCIMSSVALERLRPA